VAATFDYYEESDAVFTFNRASTASSGIHKSFWSDDNQFDDSRGSEGEVFVCTHNECFKGMTLGVPFSILIWVGTFLIFF
jgi:hypothetical protein